MNKPEQFKIQTPIGSVESDSGNHLVDVGSVLGVVVVLFILKKVISKYVR